MYALLLQTTAQFGPIGNYVSKLRNDFQWRTRSMSRREIRRTLVELQEKFQALEEFHEIRAESVEHEVIQA